MTLVPNTGLKSASHSAFPVVGSEIMLPQILIGTSNNEQMNCSFTRRLQWLMSEMKISDLRSKLHSTNKTYIPNNCGDVVKSESGLIVCENLYDTINIKFYDDQQCFFY